MEEASLLDLIYEIRQKCMQNDEEIFKSLSITKAEFNMFLCLKNCKHFNSYSVAEKMQLSLSRVSRIIDKMVNKGHLSRTTNKLDRRAIDIKMTSSGKQIMDKIVKYRDAQEAHFVNKMNNEELHQVKSCFRKIITLL